jgi:hypothetical protein
MEEGVMQLRTYPGVLNWPPVWTRISGPANLPHDETSSLEEVHHSLIEATRCFLIIQCDETRYMGTLRFDDPAMLREDSCVLEQALRAIYPGHW